jgi:hypothetical protein
MTYFCNKASFNLQWLEGCSDSASLDVRLNKFIAIIDYYFMIEILIWFHTLPLTIWKISNPDMFFQNQGHKWVCTETINWFNSLKF